MSVATTTASVATSTSAATTTAPSVRRVATAGAALALAAGLLAAAAPHADAAPRSAAAQAPAATVTSRVLVDGASLSVRDKVSASTDLTYVESVIRGKVTTACFDGDAAVPSTVRSIGSVTTGDLSSAPWYNNGGTIDVVAEPAATTTTVVAPVVLKNILRDRAGELADLDCAAGTTAGFHEYRITSVTSARFTFAGVRTASFSSGRDVTYAFPAPLA